MVTQGRLKGKTFSTKRTKFRISKPQNQMSETRHSKFYVQEDVSDRRIFQNVTNISFQQQSIRTTLTTIRYHLILLNLLKILGREGRERKRQLSKQACGAKVCKLWVRVKWGNFKNQDLSSVPSYLNTESID